MSNQTRDEAILTDYFKESLMAPVFMAIISYRPYMVYSVSGSSSALENLISFVIL